MEARQAIEGNDKIAFWKSILVGLHRIDLGIMLTFLLPILILGVSFIIFFSKPGFLKENPAVARGLPRIIMAFAVFFLLSITWKGCISVVAVPAKITHTQLLETSIIALSFAHLWMLLFLMVMAAWLILLGLTRFAEATQKVAVHEERMHPADSEPGLENDELEAPSENEERAAT